MTHFDGLEEVRRFRYQLLAAQERLASFERNEFMRKEIELKRVFAARESALSHLLRESQQQLYQATMSLTRVEQALEQLVIDSRNHL